MRFVRAKKEYSWKSKSVKKKMLNRKWKLFHIELPLWNMCIITIADSNDEKWNENGMNLNFSKKKKNWLENCEWIREMEPFLPSIGYKTNEHI